MVPAPKPLSGRTLVELHGSGAGDVAELSIAFAGRIAADLGADVVCISADGGDPLKSWGKVLPDGRRSVSRFLNHGKTLAGALPAGPADLLTCDPQLAASWGRGVSVLVRADAADAPCGSELTVLASAGLLDIMGELGRPPLAMPGNQAAYSAGAAAFDALVSSVFAETVHGTRPRSEVCVVDVAEWLNWKHFLAASFGQLDAGIGRPEDWNAFACRDGYIAVVFQDKDVPTLARLVGNEALNDPKFATLKGRRENIAAFNAILADWARTCTRSDIVEAARAGKLPFGPVLKIADLIDDRQMLDRSFLDLDAASPTFGVARLPAVWAGA